MWCLRFLTCIRRCTETIHSQGLQWFRLTESALSFLGFGTTVPTPSWGGILKVGRDAIFRAPWLIYFPGFAIFITITCYNLVGEAFRDAADPRLRDGTA